MSGASVVVAPPTVAGANTCSQLGLQDRAGELDMADHVRYVTYRVITLAWGGQGDIIVNIEVGIAD